MEPVKISLTFHDPDEEYIASILGLLLRELCPHTDVGPIIEGLIGEGLSGWSGELAEINIDVGKKKQTATNVEA